eukprot:2763300-Alexandrium_andersonii.AAC.1
MPDGLALFGLAPALALSLQGQLWATDCRQWSDWPCTETLPVDLPEHHRVARVWGELIRGPEVTDLPRMAPWVPGTPPEQPNTYTDGSVRWPFPPQWAAAGIG